MNQSKKRNIVIGALCGVLLLMVVGYAAFSSVLNITGTSKISSNWDIKITDIQVKNVVGGATNAEDPTGVGTLNATFKTNLVSPGDSIEYHITIKNGGSLNAKLDKITLSEPNNDMITFTASGLTEGEGLDAGVSKVLTVKVEYKDIPEGQEQPSSTTGTLTVKLDFSQGEGGSSLPTTQTVYRYTTDSLNIGESIEGIETTADPSTLGKNIYLKHDIVDNKIVASYVCFLMDTEYCIQGANNGDTYEVSKALLVNLFAEGTVYDYTSNIHCFNDSINVQMSDSGRIGVYDNSVQCSIHTDGRADCS